MFNKIFTNDSKKQGRGVFAKEDIAEGEIVLTIDDSHIFKKRDIPRLSKEDQDHLDYIGEGNYVVMQEPESLINHSCDPNTFVKNRKVIAMRTIQKGQEITYDYSINGIDPWEMKCSCGSAQCRGVVYGDFKKLDPDLQVKYQKYLEDWYKKEVLDMK